MSTRDRSDYLSRSFQSKLSDATAQEKELKLDTVRTILQKPQDKREPRELRTLAAQIKEIKFFKDRMK